SPFLRMCDLGRPKKKKTSRRIGETMSHPRTLNLAFVARTWIACLYPRTPLSGVYARANPPRTENLGRGWAIGIPSTVKARKSFVSLALAAVVGLVTPPSIRRPIFLLAPIATPCAACICSPSRPRAQGGRPRAGSGLDVD